MLRALSLLPSALIPSWPVFRPADPLLKVQWAVSDGPWRRYGPRPDPSVRWSMRHWLTRCSDWIDTVQMVSLAKRLTTAPDDTTLDEMWARVARDAVRTGIHADQDVRMRLVYASADRPNINFVFDARRLAAIPT